ncbi:MAG: urea carboxylase-associated family protein [Deltaproteobacteria bacterium]|nr:urea carboxylase-associated family protein [Deltaproteobacteria bacterium]
MTGASSLSDQTSASPPGTPLQEIVLPAREYLALTLEPGQTLRVIDLEGKQVLDLVGFGPDRAEKLSCLMSNLLNGTWRLMRGHVLYTNRCRPMLAIVEDTVGVHHSGGGFCSEESNFVRYGARGTRNCADNLTRALAPHGLTRAHLEYDACFNVFMNVPYAPDGSFAIQEPRSRPGDHLDLRAEMPCLLALSNCPQDRNPVNGFNPTPLKLVLFGPRDPTPG